MVGAIILNESTRLGGVGGSWYTHRRKCSTTEKRLRNFERAEPDCAGLVSLSDVVGRRRLSNARFLKSNSSRPTRFAVSVSRLRHGQHSSRRGVFLRFVVAARQPHEHAPRLRARVVSHPFSGGSAEVEAIFLHHLRPRDVWDPLGAAAGRLLRPLERLLEERRRRGPLLEHLFGQWGDAACE